MSTTEFKLPDLGEGVHEGQVIHIHVAQGQSIREDEPLMEVETDKAAVEIPSPATGLVDCVHVEEGQVVNVGEVMFTFNTSTRSSAQGSNSPLPAGEWSGVRAEQRSAQTQSQAADAPTSSHPHPNPLPEGEGFQSAARLQGLMQGTRADGSNGRRKPASPAVRTLARKLGLDIQSIDGSGPGGRVTLADVERASQAPAHTPSAAPGSAPELTASTQVAESNLASRVPAPGLATAITPTLAADTSQLPGTASSDQHGQTSHLPMTRARMTIAQTMNQSWSTIPHVTDCDDADVTDLDAMRKQFNAANPAGPKLGLLPFVVRAVASALRRHPVFNASYDTERQEIIYRRYINIALGVQTERGLIAPIIRNADQFGVTQLNAIIGELTERVRTGAFEVNDLRGGTFTISNAGAMGGSRYATPLVTPGQVAVIAVGRSRKLPWVVDDAVVPRLIMPLSVSFDHRIIDGAEEIAFQQAIIQSLQNPVHLM